MERMFRNFQKTPQVSTLAQTFFSGTALIARAEVCLTGYTYIG
jgi:hypothetical protein